MDGPKPTGNKSWNGLSLVVVLSVLSPLALIAILLRVYTRLFLQKIFGLEDYMLILGMISALGQTAILGWTLTMGMGRHMYNVGLENIEAIAKSLFALNFLFVAGFTFIKVSILLLYQRTVKNDVLSRRICKVLLVVVPAHAVATCISFIFLCSPVRYHWDKFHTTGKCLDLAASYEAQTYIFLASDIILVILPLIMLRHLTVPRRQRVYLYLLLSMGGLIPICRVLTIHSIRQHQVMSDLMWEGPGELKWPMIEMDIGIICASISTLRPLAARFFHISDIQSTVQLNQIPSISLNPDESEDLDLDRNASCNTHSSQTSHTVVQQSITSTSNKASSNGGYSRASTLHRSTRNSCMLLLLDPSLPIVARVAETRAR